jgi:dTDP-glucose pyrophosphorylase
VTPITTAVILARGLGTRMRAASAAGAALDAKAAAVADTGVKALIPIGRPFLDHVLHDLAEAGVREVVLVIGPEHHDLRAYYAALPVTRIRITFAIQQQPRGTADAVAAAKDAVGDQPFLVINSDNLYPAAALKPLAALGGPGLVGFRRSGLLTGNIPAERVAKFAAISADAQGNLARIIEKPTPEQLAPLGDDPLLSMNCWALNQRIFAACASIAPSPRGELELPDAVVRSMQDGARYRILERSEPVLDLSSRDDIAAVRTALAEHEVRL